MPPKPRPKPAVPASGAASGAVAADGADELAERLLDAQVRFALAEFTGERLAATVARDVDGVLAVAGTLALDEVADRAQVKCSARLLAVQAVGSPLVEELVGAIAEAGYDLEAGDEHRLGAVVERQAVADLVAKVLSMHDTHERLLERLTESPLVAAVASKFVAKIVADFVQQNRARAEKVPGMSSLLSLGVGAASKVRNATDRHLDQFLGDAAGRSAAYALRRTNSVTLELLRDAPVQGAIMEIWDLHADDPIGELREYLTRDDARDLALLVHALVRGARDTDYAAALLDTAVDVFFDRYGTHDVASLLTDLGLGRDDLVTQLQAYAPRVIEAARANGVLEAQIRKRLAPFFRSDEVRALLAGG